MDADGYPIGSIPFDSLIPGKWYRYLTRYTWDPPTFNQKLSQFKELDPASPEYFYAKEYNPAFAIGGTHYGEAYTNKLLMKKSGKFYPLTMVFSPEAGEIRPLDVPRDMMQRILDQTYESRKHAVKAWAAKRYPYANSRRNNTRRGRKNRKTRKVGRR